MNGYLTVSFFCFGVLIVLTYAWQRFNEPSFFPNEETLPRTVEPLRYLFLKPAYAKARLLYLVGLLVLYALLVLPGPSMVGALGGPTPKEGLSPQAWPLLIALILTGLGTAPTPVKWLNIIEEQLRRWVHAWYLVPDGIRSTIAVLDDARYDPPVGQLNFLQGPLKEKCQEDLHLARGTLSYSWARATILVMSIKSMLNGASHPLKRAAFEPFKDEFFDDILVTYRALKLDVQALNPNDEDEEEKLSRSVENLLKRVYAYIGWGIRNQVDSEREVDQILKELGFRIPDRITGRHLFDIVVPAVLLVAAIVTVFWVANDAIGRAMGATDGPPTMYKSIVAALTSAMAAQLDVRSHRLHRAQAPRGQDRAEGLARAFLEMSDPNRPQSRAGDMAGDRPFHRVLEAGGCVAIVDRYRAARRAAHRRYRCERFDRPGLVLFAGQDGNRTALVACGNDGEHLPRHPLGRRCTADRDG